MGKYVLFTGILLSVLIRGFFVLNGTDGADITKLREMGEAILKGDNPYLSISYNIYPPLALYLEAVTLNLSNFFNIPFHILTKIWPNLADIIIAVLLYKFLIGMKVKEVYASFWSLIFILNPISVIISAAHGQIDSITSLLVLVSIYLISISREPRFKLSAFLLGLAIAIKPNPLMLLPFFLTIKKINLKRKFIFLLISTTPLVLTFAPFVLQDYQQILPKIASYAGVYDFSYAAILRGLWYQNNASIWLPLSQELLEAAKLSFIAGILFLLIIFAQSKNLVKACLAVYLLFIGIYFGISAQYLIWILPLAILLRDKMVIPFSISGTIALLGFYGFFGSEILFGKFSSGLTFQSKYMLIYFLGNLFLWITTLWWIAKIVKYQIAFKGQNLFNKKIAIASLILFIISLTPVLRLVFDTFKYN